MWDAKAWGARDAASRDGGSMGQLTSANNETGVVAPAAPLPGPGPGDACLWVLAVLVWGYLGRFATVNLMVRGEWSPTTWWLPAVALGPPTVVVLAALSGLGRDVLRALAVRGCDPVQILLLFLLAAPLAFVGNEVRVVAERLFHWLPLRPIFYAAGNPDPWKHGFVYAALAVPLAEEVFVRGFLGRGLVARYGVVAGVLLTSVLYGVLYLDPGEGSAALVKGLVYHVAYLSTKSLVAAVLLHGLVNTLGFVSAVTPETGLVPGAFLATAGLTWVLAETRTTWILPGGASWPTSYATAEMPPVRGAVSRLRRPGWSAVILATAACLLFGSALTTQVREILAVPTAGLRR